MKPSQMAALAAIALAAPAAAGGNVKIYSAGNAPAAAKLEDLPLRKTVRQYGITWTFDRPARVGRFIGGDYYVAGPVTVAKIDPAPRFGREVADDELDANEKRLKRVDHRLRNGSMLNPPAAQRVAYDSGIRNWYRPELAAKLPIRMKPGDSLVSTISLKLGEKIKFPYHADGLRGQGDHSPVRVAAVLTCMAEPQPADAFRPAYCDTANKVYLARDLRRALLGKLPKPASAPKLATWVRVFQRPWVNTGFFEFEQPRENMPQYGQWVGQAQSMAGLMLMLDFTPAEKEPLLIGVVQVGIDYWGAVRGGHPGWQGWGGHGSGRKFPIVFAGILLGDKTMAAPTKAFPKVNFGEDNQTVYRDCWTGAKVCFAGHSGIHHGTGKVPRAKWGPYEHLHPREWMTNGLNGTQSEAYRRANSSSSWVGQALVLRMLGGERQWNHDAFFDYVDRWMYEDDAEHRKVITEHTTLKLPDRKTWARQGQAWEKFVTHMWFKHRPTLKAPTDGWKKGKIKSTSPGSPAPAGRLE